VKCINREGSRTAEDFINKFLLLQCHKIQKPASLLGLIRQWYNRLFFRNAWKQRSSSGLMTQ